MKRAIRAARSFEGQGPQEGDHGRGELPVELAVVEANCELTLLQIYYFPRYLFFCHFHTFLYRLYYCSTKIKKLKTKNRIGLLMRSDTCMVT